MQDLDRLPSPSGEASIRKRFGSASTWTGKKESMELEAIIAKATDDGKAWIVHDWSTIGAQRAYSRILASSALGLYGFPT